MPTSVRRAPASRRQARDDTSAYVAGSYQPGLVGEHHQLRAVPGVELHHGPAHVGPCRRRAHDELVGDLVVGQALRDQRDDLAFAVGEHRHGTAA